MATFKRIAAVILIGIALVVGVAAYSILKTPAEATGPIEAIPLAESTPASSAASATTAVEAPTAEAPASTPAPSTADSPAPTAAAAQSSDSLIVQIVQDESEARFIIDEVLNNAPKTVVGATNQIAGEIAIDPQDPTKTRVGVIQVNARALATDNNLRNRTIKNQILQTDQYEFVTFTPTEIVGLPQDGAVGESYTFQIVGDLTIRDVTKSVTFDVTTTAASEARLEGTAQTTILYADYGISIPQVRQVASVSDQVRLEIDFVAVPK
jgi:polyisoprenoid-binding protein YceI